MKLMISVVNKQEALIAQEAHADLIDIKNPAEGSLGAQNPMVIKEIMAALDPAVLVSSVIQFLKRKTAAKCCLSSRPCPCYGKSHAYPERPSKTFAGQD